MDEISELGTSFPHRRNESGSKGNICKLQRDLDIGSNLSNSTYSFCSMFWKGSYKANFDRSAPHEESTPALLHLSATATKEH
ncbi:hypothetical protein V6N13_119559 [Hibiscus sabdariffa]|uniref:Uncharacterized protein n=1 Tax=Hibiscus sabdariffa TaxID=183260 RepID=A0ABR2E259_9ROSI